MGDNNTVQEPKEGTITQIIKEELLDIIGLEANVLQLSKDQDKLAKLWGAYSRFLGVVVNPKKTKKAAFSNYSPLEEVLSTINPILAKFGLAVMQTSYSIGEQHAGVTTIMSHIDGAYIVFPPVKIRMQKTDAQGYGAAVTYGRRYGFSTVCAIASENDDDGGLPTEKKQPPTPVTEIKKLQNEILGLSKKMATKKRRAEAIEIVGHGGVPSKIKDVKEAKEVIVKLNEALKGEGE
jgi:hypothetical protein